MTVKATPIGPRLLVKPLEANEMHGGIILPDEVRVRQSRAMVMEVGKWYKGLDDEGPDMVPLGIEVGAVVVHAHGSGVAIRLDLAENGEWEDFLVLHINDVLLTLTEVEAGVLRR